MVDARLRGRDVQPVVIADPARVRHAIEGITDTFDRPAEDASLAIDGITVRQTPAATGQAINFDGAIATLMAEAGAGHWPIQGVGLPHASIEPVVTDASAAMDAAETLLAADVVLDLDEDEWRLNPPTLGPMLTTMRAGDVVALDIDRERFAQWLAPASDVISRTSKPPRFHFDDESGELVLVEPGLTQRRVDMNGTVAHVLAAGLSGTRHTTVAVHEVPPEILDDVSASELGIRELIREETSHYVGSPAGRIHNIGIATSRFDGLLVAPDAVFSFHQAVGDISSEAGYEETLIIMDGTTTDGVGGGVCQVSTTLFRAVFWAGLPVVERYPHGYRVAYYEQQSIVGLDATVYSPVVDLKFNNDTGHWLLIETETDPTAATATFRVYGTKPEGDVELVGPKITDTVAPPEPRFEVDPELAPGEFHVIEYARSGASVSVTRVMTRNGETSSEVFYSRYRPTGKVTAFAPTQAVYSVGDGLTPGPADGYPPADAAAP
jgi:vancomycin resistance protein YoaR